MNFASFAASSTTSAIITYSYDRMAELSKAPNTLQSPRLSGAAGRLTSPALFPPPSADNATYYYQIDGNKNVTELTDASGAVVAHYEYSPFGGVVTATGTYAEDNPFRFSSEYYDSETGLVYYNYRYYSPNLSSCLKPDPIDEQGGWNLYAMVRNNVIDNWDHNGQRLGFIFSFFSLRNCIKKAEKRHEDCLSLCANLKCDSSVNECIEPCNTEYFYSVAICSTEYLVKSLSSLVLTDVFYKMAGP